MKLIRAVKRNCLQHQLENFCFSEKLTNGFELRDNLVSHAIVHTSIMLMCLWITLWKKLTINLTFYFSRKCLPPVCRKCLPPVCIADWSQSRSFVHHNFLRLRPVSTTHCVCLKNWHGNYPDSILNTVSAAMFVAYASQHYSSSRNFHNRLLRVM